MSKLEYRVWNIAGLISFVSWIFYAYVDVRFPIAALFGMILTALAMSIFSEFFNDVVALRIAYAIGIILDVIFFEIASNMFGWEFPVYLKLIASCTMSILVPSIVALKQHVK